MKTSVDSADGLLRVAAKAMDITINVVTKEIGRIKYFAIKLQRDARPQKQTA